MTFARSPTKPFFLRLMRENANIESWKLPFLVWLFKQREGSWSIIEMETNKNSFPHLAAAS